MFACNRSDCVEGEGDNFDDERNTAPFHTILTEIPMNLFLTHDTNLTNGIVNISAQENIQNKISAVVKDKVLRIYFNSCIDGNNDINVHIESAEIKEIIAGSPIKIFSKRAVLSDSLRIQFLQSSNADIFFAGDFLETEFQASGQVIFKGITNKFSCNTQANIELDAYDLLADTVIINTNSINDSKIFANKLIEADINGSGDVLYKGFPEFNLEGNGPGQLIEDN